MDYNTIKFYLSKQVAHYFPTHYINYQWKKRFNRPLNWANPEDLNEKIQWLKRFTDTSTWTMLADKYLVRQYVKERGFEGILVKLYGKWDNAYDIDWATLPNEFVLKVNNGSGDVILCKDKKSLNIEKTIKTLNNLLNKKFGYSTVEHHYLSINPCIIAEELLDINKQPIKSSSLIDYKIWCINGKPEFVWTCQNRTKVSLDVAAYDLDWNYHPEWSNFTDHYKRAEKMIPKPKTLERMIEIAEKLSDGFPQVRIDLYEVDEKPYFGEMTFTSDFGMMEYFSSDFCLRIGQKINLDSGNITLKKNY